MASIYVVVERPVLLRRNDAYSARHTSHPGVWRLPSLAIQPQLGLLSERRIRVDPADRPYHRAIQPWTVEPQVCKYNSEGKKKERRIGAPFLCSARPEL